MFGWNSHDAATEPRTAEPSGAAEGSDAPLEAGFLAGTYVATDTGWRAVELLAVGDLVMTFDNDLQPITNLSRRTVWQRGQDIPQREWPLLVPVGVFDNGYDMLVLPGQGLMVESDWGQMAYGDPFIIVPVHALEGVRGIARQRPQRSMEVITLELEQDNLVYAEGGALMHCAAQGSASGAMLAPRQAAFAARSLSA
ncbi:MAG: hypothetical protein HKN30_04660 [Sulfitobacter sp.]|nr:hypothetical protein [Sulfitobacter sp.]